MVAWYPKHHARVLCKAVCNKCKLAVYSQLVPACVAIPQSRTYYKQAWHDETLITGYSWEIKAFWSRKENFPSFMILSQMMTAWNGASCSVSKRWHLWTTVTRPRSSSLLGCEFIYHAQTARNLWELSGIWCLKVLLLREGIYCKFLRYLMKSLSLRVWYRPVHLHRFMSQCLPASYITHVRWVHLMDQWKTQWTMN